MMTVLDMVHIPFIAIISLIKFTVGTLSRVIIDVL